MPDRPSPLTPAELKALRAHAERYPGEDDTLRLLDMVDGYKQLVRLSVAQDYPPGSDRAHLFGSTGPEVWDGISGHRPRPLDPDLALLLDAALTAGQGEDTPHG